MLNKVFWALICLEGAAIVPFLIHVLSTHRKGVDDSLAMFFALFPTIVLAAVAIAYRCTKSPAVHGALLVVPLLFTIPGINAIYNLYGSYALNYETAYGVGIFDDPGLSALLKAVGKRDEAQVRKLAQAVDINAVAPEKWLHPSPYTPIRFAVERAVAAEREGKYVTESRRMVEVLLSLGTKPSSALIYACRSSATDLIRMLLDAGADPNYETPRLLFGKQTTHDLPFYGCVDTPDSMLGSLELLASHGARFAVLDSSTAYPMRTAILNNRWDQVLFLYDHGLPMETDAAMKNAVEQAARQTGKSGEQLSRLRQIIGLQPQQ